VHSAFKFQNEKECAIRLVEFNRYVERFRNGTLDSIREHMYDKTSKSIQKCMHRGRDKDRKIYEVYGFEADRLTVYRVIYHEYGPTLVTSLKFIRNYIISGGECGHHVFDQVLSRCLSYLVDMMIFMNGEFLGPFSHEYDYDFDVDRVFCEDISIHDRKKMYDFWSTVYTMLSAASVVGLLKSDLKHKTIDFQININTIICNSVWNNIKTQLKSFHELENCYVYHEGKVYDRVNFRKLCGYGSLREKFVKNGSTNIDDVKDRLSDKIVKVEPLSVKRLSVKCGCEKKFAYIKTDIEVTTEHVDAIIKQGRIVVISPLDLSEFSDTFEYAVNLYIKMYNTYEDIVYVSDTIPLFDHTLAFYEEDTWYVSFAEKHIRSKLFESKRL
jgi:hypothetical protein